jgi:hypothetical protein
MKPANPLVTEVASLRATEYSPDGKKVTVALTTKYASERVYSVPLACLSEFIADLERLKTAEPELPAVTASATETKPVAAASAPAQRAAALNEIKITLPKKWMLASGLPRHPMVILVFDPQTEAQAGFGFGGPAAREMAAGLLKYADQIEQRPETAPKD